MSISELLGEFRKIFGNERDKGTAFEKLIKMYLENEPKYMALLTNVWMWNEFPYRGNIGNKEYIPFDGIVLTDTFQLYEDTEENEWTKNINELTLPQNSERALKQRELPITVCIGNPPYSVGQKS